MAVVPALARCPRRRVAQRLAADWARLRLRKVQPSRRFRVERVRSPLRVETAGPARIGSAERLDIGRDRHCAQCRLAETAGQQHLRHREVAVLPCVSKKCVTRGSLWQTSASGGARCGFPSCSPSPPKLARDRRHQSRRARDWAGSTRDSPQRTPGFRLRTNRSAR